MKVKELKQQPKFDITRIIYWLAGIIALSPVIFLLYVFVIGTGMAEVKIRYNVNQYFNALSNQNYEKASKHILIGSSLNDGHTLLEYGDRDQWIAKFTRLEEAGIKIERVQNIQISQKDFCIGGAYFEVVISQDGEEYIFDERVASIPHCTIGFQYKTFMIYYHPNDVSSDQFWDEVVILLHEQGHIDDQLFAQYRALEVTYDYVRQQVGVNMNMVFNEVSDRINSGQIRVYSPVDMARYAISSEWLSD